MRLLPAGSKHKLPKTFVTLGLWHFCALAGEAHGSPVYQITGLPNQPKYRDNQIPGNYFLKKISRKNQAVLCV